MTAAKRRRGGTLARLEVLEAKEAARLEAVRAEKWAAITGAEARLSREDRAAIEDAGGLTGEDLDPDTLARMMEASRTLPEVPPIEDPAKEEALAWAEACLDVADGAPYGAKKRPGLLLRRKCLGWPGGVRPFGALMRLYAGS